MGDAVQKKSLRGCINEVNDIVKLRDEFMDIFPIDGSNKNRVKKFNGLVCDMGTL